MPKYVWLVDCPKETMVDAKVMVEAVMDEPRREEYVSVFTLSALTEIVDPVRVETATVEPCSVEKEMVDALMVLTVADEPRRDEKVKAPTAMVLPDNVLTVMDDPAMEE